MAHAKEESADMAKIASALVLNIGTLTNELIESMKLAGKAANEKGIPTFVDPKKRNFTEYKGVTLFKPNLKELLFLPLAHPVESRQLPAHFPQNR